MFYFAVLGVIKESPELRKDCEGDDCNDTLLEALMIPILI